ncbi:hypothetical protein GCM10017083_00740 [Thalassobaculum fulvum]|uniref:histidine kinase n=1 Tax=Thalassobaculum fulvum TaxID=1633335 RepID=A0A918XMH4_9PROT|nr:ATP-binding protein [Thalassobaculum fulvum]GHD39181.1 hypothetical protein GCM10017083_00740 [Thalassobaculum fulvum]
MLGASVTSAVAVLHSLGILALMAIGISMLQPGRSGDTPGWQRSVTMGAVFGLAVAIVMADPVVFPMGATIDPRGGPAMLAGVYGGPAAAVVAGAIGGAMRGWIGGPGAVGGMTGIAVYTIVGILGWALLRRQASRPSLTWLLGFAVIGTLCALPTAFLLPDWRMGFELLSKAWWLVLTGNVTGVLVLGFLLEQDWRRRSLEQELRQTESRTRAAAEAKTRFLASMSHEIRTPMNAVVGFVDLLRDSKLDSFQRRCTDQIGDAAQGLLRIIDDILDFAKIDSGGVALDLRPVDVVELVESCREMLLPQLEAKGIACTLDLPSDLPGTVEADPVRLRQVLLNLLGNAVKFTDAGRIAVSVRHAAGPADAPGDLTITIADSGIGMTEAEMAQLFSPFVQGDHVGRGGTGLGLVISRMLVQAMGGELTVESTRGEGTTVTVRVPVRRSTAAVPKSAVGGAAPGKPAGLRILVAEDVPLNAEMLEVTLRQSNHSVLVVPDGQQAVDAVRGSPFDLVLMDVQMPVMDGLAATRAIRALDGPAAAVPIVALTAYASREDLRACLDAGMNDFLTKPLERAKLEEVLQRWGGAGSTRPAPAVSPPELPPDPVAAAAEGPPDRGADGSLTRIGELLDRLAGLERDDREAVRSTALNLVAASGDAGLDSLADRSRRLVAAAPRSNVEALNALIEDVADAGRRSLRTLDPTAGGDRR